jgi:hypothetical protein
LAGWFKYKSLGNESNSKFWDVSIFYDLNIGFRLFFLNCDCHNHIAVVHPMIVARSKNSS